MNEALRDHVTSAAFVLSLGKTHVAALVRLDLELAAEVQVHVGPNQFSGARLHRHDVTGRSFQVSSVSYRVWARCSIRATSSAWRYSNPDEFRKPAPE